MGNHFDIAFWIYVLRLLSKARSGRWWWAFLRCACDWTINGFFYTVIVCTFPIAALGSNGFRDFLENVTAVFFITIIDDLPVPVEACVMLLQMGIDDTATNQQLAQQDSLGPLEESLLQGSSSASPPAAPTRHSDAAQTIQFGDVVRTKWFVDLAAVWHSFTPRSTINVAEHDREFLVRRLKQGIDGLVQRRDEDGQLVVTFGTEDRQNTFILFDMKLSSSQVDFQRRPSCIEKFQMLQLRTMQAELQECKKSA